MTPILERHPKPPTWADLVALEPRLAELLAEAHSVANDDPYFCRDSCLDSGYQRGPSFRKRLRTLLNRNEERIRDSLPGHPRAFYVAYYTLYDALPTCRNRECPADFREER